MLVDPISFNQTLFEQHWTFFKNHKELYSEQLREYKQKIWKLLQICRTAGRQSGCVGDEMAEPRLSAAQEFPLTGEKSWRRLAQVDLC